MISKQPRQKGFVGALLLIAYSRGHCGLALVGGTSMGMVQRLADSRGWNRGCDDWQEW
jgi:hypothetical protein